MGMKNHDQAKWGLPVFDFNTSGFITEHSTYPIGFGKGMVRPPKPQEVRI